MPLEALIAVRSGSQTLAKSRLDEGDSVVVGRSTNVELSFPDDSWMSRRHFRIALDPGGLVLEDLGSRNGVRVNGKAADKKTIALVDRDQIQAGETFFEVRVREKRVQREPSPATSTSAEREQKCPPPPPDRGRGPAATVKLDISDLGTTSLVLRVLYGSRRPLFGLFDAACGREVARLLDSSRDDVRSLDSRADLLTAPRIASLSFGAPLLRLLVEGGWGQGWGVYFSSSASLDELTTHFAHWLTVETPAGQELTFPYYDPRVLHQALPALLPEEQARFFGPVSRFVYQADNPNVMRSLKFHRGQLLFSEKPLLELAAS